MEPNLDLPSTSRDSISLIESKRGNPVLLCGGYEHTQKRKNKNGSIVWRCVNRKCRGIIVTVNNTVKKTLNHNVCKSNESKNVIKEEIYRCKKEARTADGKSIPSILNAGLKRLKDKGTNMVETLPNLNNVKTSLYTARNKSQRIQKSSFRKPFEVQVPVSYKSFLFFDYYYKKTRIIAFAEEESKKLLHNVQHYLADGTYKCVIKPFKQLYVIYGDLGSTNEKINVVPLIYVLLMDKKESTYETLFSLIKSQIPDWNPITFRTDYEKAAMNGIRKIFPNVICKGCYFHFCQAIWKRAKALKLNKNKILKKHIALCASLALLPSELKCDGWLYIMEDCPRIEKINKFNDYFVSAWLDNEYLKGKWDFYGDTFRTNNPVEGGNARLNRTFSGKLNIISFLNKIKSDAQSGVLSQGKPRRKEDILYDKMINASIAAMMNGSITIGHCLEKICPFVF